MPIPSDCLFRLNTVCTWRSEKTQAERNTSFWHSSSDHLSLGTCDNVLDVHFFWTGSFLISGQTLMFYSGIFQRCPCWLFLVKVLFWLFDYAFVFYQCFVCGQKHILPYGYWIGLLPPNHPSDMWSYCYFFSDDAIGHVTIIDYRFN